MTNEERLDRRIDALGERINDRLDEHFAKMLEWQGERVEEIAHIQAALDSHLSNHHGPLSKAKFSVGASAVAGIAVAAVEIVKRLFF